MDPDFLLRLFGKRFRWIIPFIFLASLLLGACGPRQAVNAPTGSSLLFPASPPTTTAPVSTGQPPVILDLQTHKASTAVGVVISADIHYQDPDGDAETLAFETVQSTLRGFVLEPESIEASPQEQMQGATQTVEYICQDSGTQIQLRVVVLDRAGHHSNLVPMLIDCG